MGRTTSLILRTAIAVLDERRKQRIREEKKIQKLKIETERMAMKISCFEMFKEHCNNLRSNPSQIKVHLFVPKTTFDLIVDSVEKSVSAANQKTDAFGKTVLFLTHVTAGESYGVISRRVGLSLTTVSNIIHNVALSIKQHMPGIKTPKNVEEWRAVERSFAGRGLMRCIGALDGKHVRIRAPPHSASLFYNYKNYFSFVMLALVDGDKRFIFLDVGAAGSANDSSIFQQSSLKTALEEGTLPPPTYWDTNHVFPSFLVADGAFPSSSRIMKPYGNVNLSHQHQQFNAKLSAARVKSENAFGELAARFRILYQQMECAYPAAVDIVVALCILHNNIVEKTEFEAEDLVEADVPIDYTEQEQRDHLRHFYQQ